MSKQVKQQVAVSGLLSALLVAVSGASFAAGIADTKHNLSMSNNNGTIKSTDQTEICIFCHTPHAAIKNNSIPLWNHNLSSTAATYGTYTSPTFNATMTEVGGSNNSAANAVVSNLCMSCHDGTIAVNSFNNPSNIRPTTTMTGGSGAGSAFIGAGSTNLSTLTTSHPVNITYDAALVTSNGTNADGLNGLNDPSTLTGVKLFSGVMQCGSCHDAHTSAETLSGKPAAFLRTTMSGSALCFKCHAK